MNLILQKPDATKWLARLLEAAEVIAPVQGADGDAIFSTVTSAQNVLWDFSNPLPPPKQFILPQTHPLIQIKRDGKRHKVESICDNRRRVLFNVRSCDVKGMAFLARMQAADPPDESYLRRVENLTLISLACNAPCPLGFCVCTDSGPFLSNSYDIQITDMGKTYLVEVASDKGRAAIEQAPGVFRPATEFDVAERQRLEGESRKHFGAETCHFGSAMRRISTGRVPDALWDKMSDWCLECGACNHLCPVCYCFSVKDLARDGTWIRCRLWDSCQYAAFTLEASGNNPRAQRKERMKRRFFHKVSAQYYQRDEAVGCVGCGRCVKACLGSTDMPAVVGAIRKGRWHE